MPGPKRTSGRRGMQGPRRSTVPSLRRRLREGTSLPGLLDDVLASVQEQLLPFRGEADRGRAWAAELAGHARAPRIEHRDLAAPPFSLPVSAGESARDPLTFGGDDEAAEEYRLSSRSLDNALSSVG